VTRVFASAKLQGPQHNPIHRSRDSIRIRCISIVICLLISACDSPIAPEQIVEPGPPASIEIRDFIVRLVQGDSLRLEAQTFDSQGRRVPDIEPTWMSWDFNVATISDSGVLRGLRPGWTVVRASHSSSITDSAFVAVVLRFKSISVGNFHACAITAEKAMYCWGESRRYSPASLIPAGPLATPVLQTTDAESVAAGEDHTCRITTSTITYCWGGDPYGQRGDGPAFGSFSPPNPVILPEALVTLSASSYHNCGTAASERVYCWGVNDTGELGIWPDTMPIADGCFSYVCRTQPVEVPDVRLRSVSAGHEHTCGLDRDGRAYCWGANESGQLGIGVIGDTLPPQSVATSLRFKSIAAGYQRTCGITIDGDLYCWGRIDHSTLGVSCYPLQPSVRCVSSPAQVEPGVKFKSVSLFTTMCAVSAASTLYCSTSVPETSDAPIFLAKVSSDVTFESVDVGSFFRCALGTNEAAYCWDSSNSGTGLPRRSYPVMVSPPGPVPALGGES
jgi:alpha-tubulin suppressor-like RCC1 family protein